MVTDFQDRLREIREAKDRESEAQRALDSAAVVDRFSKMELRFVLREKIAGVIEEFSIHFMEEVPAFNLSKSFFEGKYRIEVHTDDLLIDDTGRVDKYFSRITFLIDPKPETRSPDRPAEDMLHVRCKKTVRNRDLESQILLVGSAAEDVEAFRGFVDEQFIEFAGEYFTRSSRASAS